MFPDAKCELDYTNLYELTIAVVLSAQTTDKRVNEVTKILFNKYPNYLSLSNARIDDVIDIIRPLGMYNNKAKNIISLANEVVMLNHEPESYDEFINLTGVGRKCANVILSEYFKEPHIAVDTHVFRVAKRLGLSNGNNPLKVENDLMELFDKNLWYFLHIHLVHLGRYMCKAASPICSKCCLNSMCEHYKMNKNK